MTTPVANDDIMRKMDTLEVSAKFSEKMGAYREALAKVTGAEGDVELDSEISQEGASLTFTDVSFSVRSKANEKLILAPTSGHFPPGTLAAIMGPSGCGKSTLLDILAMKKTTPWEGSVRFNGHEPDCLYPRMTAYVPQSDAMPAHWTVREAVQFSMILKREFPSKMTAEMLNRMVDMTLSMVGLEHVASTKIGSEKVRGISGGQRRRVSLARGFMTGAQIMFCDEPTSGLSATDADLCVKAMRLLAHRCNVTILVVIHQPRREVAQLFDHLLLLTSNPGRCVYNGAMRDAVMHWDMLGHPVPQYANPTDHFLDLVTPGVDGAHEEEFVEYYNSKIAPGVKETSMQQSKGKTPLHILEAERQKFLAWGYIPPVKSSKYGASFAKQLQMIVRRQMALSVRDSEGLLAELVLAVVKGLVLGVAFWGYGSEQPQQQLGLLFMLLAFCMLSGNESMPKLIDARVVMKMETSDALYSEWAYIIGASVLNLLVSFMANSIFVAITFAMAQFSWELFPVVFIWSSLVWLTFVGMFEMLAAMSTDMASAQNVSMLPILIFFLWNGFMVTKGGSEAWNGWIIYANPAAYAIEAITLTARDIEDDADKLAQWNGIIDINGYEDLSSVGAAVMLACAVIFRVGQVLALTKMHNIER